MEFMVATGRVELPTPGIWIWIHGICNTVKSQWKFKNFDSLRRFRLSFL